MKELKNDLYLLCESVYAITAEHLNDISTKTYDEKAVIAKHYSYSSRLLKCTSDLDNITLRASSKISEHDHPNQIESLAHAGAFFDLCIEYRKIIENYFSECEATIKSKPTNIQQKLRYHTDCFFRKTFKKEVGVSPLEYRKKSYLV